MIKNIQIKGQLKVSKVSSRSARSVQGHHKVILRSSQGHPKVSKGHLKVIPKSARASKGKLLSQFQQIYRPTDRQTNKVTYRAAQGS